MRQPYADFLATKRRTVAKCGVTPATLPGTLWDWQSALVKWALRIGRAALWTDTGTGKTLMQCAWAQEIARRGNVLIIAPLAVAQQTVREAQRIGLDVTHSRFGTIGDGVTITNYERLHYFDPSQFTGVVLDESSILKSFAGKTRTALIDAFRGTPYKLACTATPGPNDCMELGNHAEFLGVCSYTEMLSEWFVHDGSGATNSWRLKGHARRDFWAWLASWAATMRKPSDLGYADGAYALPPIDVRQHIVATRHDCRADGTLFAADVTDIQSRRAARRDSLDDRVRLCADLANANGEPWVVWCDLNAESAAAAKAIHGAIEVRGSQTADEKEARLVAFAEGSARVMVTKPSIAGFGLNWQHCRNMCFLGLSDSYEAYYQAVRRCWRYGQSQPVAVHVIVSDREGAVLKNIGRKSENADDMHDGMVEASRVEISDTTARKREYAVDVASGDGWTMHLGDAVELAKGCDSNSIDYSIFSPPFASLYTYSDSERDMGNCRDHGEFMRQFRYLINELLRITCDGRLLSFHCMNLPQTKMRDGKIGIVDFRGMLIAAFVESGWIYHSEVVIWKDPVVAMQRTKAIGLLYKQIKKDSSLSRQGFPDYLVTMRKPGENAKPIAHTESELPLPYWQRYASPVWHDIRQSDTLQYRAAREHADERHICPLQLGVIERAITLWSSPGDLVLSPFAGLGSEGYVAVRKRRRFLGYELKRSYYNSAVRNLAEACTTTSSQLEIFA